MLNNHYIEKLLGLKDIIVTKIENDPDALHIYCELPRRTHHCPQCQQRTDKVHDYRFQVFKDAPAFGLNTFFHYRKRRYSCNHCNKRFYEKNTFLPRYFRMSTRLVQYVIDRMRSTHSMTDIAKHCNLSITTIFRLFKFIDYTNTSLPRVLSIDEFKGNAGRKYQGILTDPVNKKVLDVLPGREHHILSDYFRRFNNRDKVAYFVMDMWQPYRDIAETYFKNATIVIDKYHWIRQITWAFDRVRKQEQKKFYKTRRKYFKRSRHLLLKRRRFLTDEQVDQVSVMLDTSSRLRTAYLLKEKFYDFVDAPDKGTALKRLKEWYIFVATQNEPEFITCMNTIINWQKYILNSFTCPYTNGYTEGVNNKIKVLKRNAYGMRNFNRFKNRILHMMS
jgi:transposase